MGLLRRPREGLQEAPPCNIGGRGVAVAWLMAVVWPWRGRGVADGRGVAVAWPMIFPTRRVAQLMFRTEHSMHT